MYDFIPPDFMIAQATGVDVSSTGFWFDQVHKRIHMLSELALHPGSGAPFIAFISSEDTFALGTTGHSGTLGGTCLATHMCSVADNPR